MATAMKKSTLEEIMVAFKDKPLLIWQEERLGGRFIAPILARLNGRENIRCFYDAISGSPVHGFDYDVIVKEDFTLLHNRDLLAAEMIGNIIVPLIPKSELDRAQINVGLDFENDTEIFSYVMEQIDPHALAMSKVSQKKIVFHFIECVDLISDFKLQE